MQQIKIKENDHEKKKSFVIFFNLLFIIKTLASEWVHYLAIEQKQIVYYVYTNKHITNGGTGHIHALKYSARI
jgi:hypothetical protein